MYCWKCGTPCSSDIAICQVCSAPIPWFSSNQVPVRPIVRPRKLEFVGFGRRTIAGAIDLLVLGVPVAVAVSFLSVWDQTWPAFLKLHPGQTPAEIAAAFGHDFLVKIFFFFILTSWLYFAFMESSFWQATLGKMMLSIRVTDAKGDRISFWRASLRFAVGRLLLHIPSIGVLYFIVDCICMGLTSRKQAFHDKVASCVVTSDDFSLRD